jgi:hypothetical protein
VLTGPRKHQQLAVARRRSYFGFELESEVTPLRRQVPQDLLPAARRSLVRALIEGETPHRDQGKVRRSAAILRDWWRRSGGRLDAASDTAIEDYLVQQLRSVDSLDHFLETRLVLEPERLVNESERQRLDELPAMFRLFGDAVPIDYEVAGGVGIARIRLREGQARRMTEVDVPTLDRPVRFAVVRAGSPPLLADSLPELRKVLAAARQQSTGSRGRHRPPRRGGRRRGPR